MSNEIFFLYYKKQHMQWNAPFFTQVQRVSSLSALPSDSLCRFDSRWQRSNFKRVWASHKDKHFQEREREGWRERWICPHFDKQHFTYIVWPSCWKIRYYESVSGSFTATERKNKEFSRVCSCHKVRPLSCSLQESDLLWFCSLSSSTSQLTTY